MSDKKISNITVEKGIKDTTSDEYGSISMGPDGVKLYRLLMIKSGMESEHIRGMRLTRKVPSCFTIVKKEFGLKGNKLKVYQTFCAMHGFDVHPDMKPST